ncbi:MAG: hypothetical protein JRF54_00190, partial [Deltaproteobacteria bacterium]|nr:hypothetical protein [Deltaproteobacteria bacterium]
ASCIDYSTVVQPIFDAECIHCHGGPAPLLGLSLESYEGVLIGGPSGSEVVACQPDSSLLYLKILLDSPPSGARMPADGPPFLTSVQIEAIEQWLNEGARASCAEPDPCTDMTDPTFGGLSSATLSGPTSTQLCWAAGSDDTTPAGDLVYDVYQATFSDGEDFGAPPRMTTMPGDECIVIDALSPQTLYCWVVRARDGAGNQDDNTDELCRTTPSVPGGCVDYATMIQPLFNRNCTRCHSGSSPPQWLLLDSYENVLAGSVRRSEVDGCDAAGSLLVNKIGPSPSIGVRMPLDGPPYLSSAEVAMISQWIENGAQRSCGEASSCMDQTAPIFGGATTASASSNTSVRVCWNPATDDTTSGESIRYDIYQAASPGGENFSQPPQNTVTGAVCTDIRVGPGTSMCFVVRARDVVGNGDGNSWEVCATTATSACAVEYAELIEPIFSARCTHCHRDAISSPRFLDLRSYGATRAGGSLRRAVRGCDWAGSLLNLKTSRDECGNRMPFDGPPWLAPAERSLLEHWIESGARESCSDQDPCGDTTAPTFGGVTSVTQVEPTTLDVCWNPATDDTTRTDAIVYEIYDAAQPGGANFGAVAPYAVSGGSGCAAVTVPMGSQTCFAVRARDLAGNRDLNTAERCHTTANSCFAYDPIVQPIFDARCVHCHSGPGAPQGIRWDTYAHAIADPGAVRPCRADNSDLIDVVEGCDMPQDTTSGACRACLTRSRLRLLTQWVDGGANQSCPWGGC